MSGLHVSGRYPLDAVELPIRVLPQRTHADADPLPGGHVAPYGPTRCVRLESVTLTGECQSIRDRTLDQCH
jgi:hypothetical protein